MGAGGGGGGVQIAAPAKYFHQGKKNLNPPFFGDIICNISSHGRASIRK